MVDESNTERALAALRSRNPFERLTAIETLARARYRAGVLALIEVATDDPADNVREAAIWALGDIASESALSFLLKIIDDDSESHANRWAALYGLGTVHHADALPKIFHLYYSDNDMELRQAAGRTILRFGQGAAPFLVDVLQKRRTRGVDARAAAAQLLGRVRAKSAVPALLEAINQDEPNVRWDAIKALGDIGDPQAVPHLIRLLNDENVLVGKIAVWALETISTTDAIAAASRWREENEYYPDREDGDSDQPPLLPPPRPDGYGPF